MIPLPMADVGEECVIKKVSGVPDVKSHLEDLGFVPGAVISIVTVMGGNVIVNIKDSRIAISEELARKIMV
ncbi:MAG: ferrous iron transport protein A [Oscillospiraceae bacterium]|nr:ferrous iron transport protein A [Oscillospiraceae bacterium]